MRVNGVEPEGSRPGLRHPDGGRSDTEHAVPWVFDPNTGTKPQQHNDAQAAKDAMKAAYSAANHAALPVSARGRSHQPASAFEPARPVLGHQ